ncbi:hypothetical protein GVAV_000337 [Gurleya vavrai]
MLNNIEEECKTICIYKPKSLNIILSKFIFIVYKILCILNEPKYKSNMEIDQLQNEYIINKESMDLVVLVKRRLSYSIKKNRIEYKFVQIGLIMFLLILVTLAAFNRILNMKLTYEVFCLKNKSEIKKKEKLQSFLYSIINQNFSEKIVCLKNDFNFIREENLNDAIKEFYLEIHEIEEESQRLHEISLEDDLFSFEFSRIEVTRIFAPVAPRTRRRKKGFWAGLGRFLNNLHDWIIVEFCMGKQEDDND